MSVDSWGGAVNIGGSDESLGGGVGSSEVEVMNAEGKTEFITSLKKSRGLEGATGRLAGVTDSEGKMEWAGLVDAVETEELEDTEVSLWKVEGWNVELMDVEKSSEEVVSLNSESKGVISGLEVVVNSVFTDNRETVDVSSSSSRPAMNSIFGLFEIIPGFIVGITSGFLATNIGSSFMLVSFSTGIWDGSRSRCLSG